MGITRKSLFGFPPAPHQGSEYTQREVPLTQGMRTDTPWPVLPPGSAVSMINFLPLDGALIPRSRLSSLNTLRTLGNVAGMVERTDAGALTSEIWASTATRHGYVTSNGSISVASFVSSYGLGTPPTLTSANWQYGQAFFATIGSNGNNAIIGASDSNDTMVVLWRDASAGAKPLFSYLTEGPRARSVTDFDSYLVAFNISPGGNNAPTRVQWNQRGIPSGWTAEGSGFEDLLDMRGVGVAVRGSADERLILWSESEIWYGVRATYPAQFQFFPLDRGVGCHAPGTIQKSEMGFFFLGSDGTLRLLPHGGGPPQIISAAVSKLLRRSAGQFSWGLFDAATRLYHLFAFATNGTEWVGYVFNVDTGEWGRATYGTGTLDPPRRGLAVIQRTLSHAGNEGLYFANSNGTIYSTSSLLLSDDAGAVASIWRSAPIAADLPGNYKQLTQIDVDYRATSAATLLIQVSQDGGNVYDNTINTVSLPVSIAGRATAQVYVGGAFPTLNVASTSTGYELHRVDVTMTLGGRRA